MMNGTSFALVLTIVSLNASMQSNLSVSEGNNYVHCNFTIDADSFTTMMCKYPTHMKNDMGLLAKILNKEMFEHTTCSSVINYCGLDNNCNFAVHLCPIDLFMLAMRYQSVVFQKNNFDVGTQTDL